MTLPDCPSKKKQKAAAINIVMEVGTGALKILKNRFRAEGKRAPYAI